jgi:hypothetical protein
VIHFFWVSFQLATRIEQCFGIELGAENVNLSILCRLSNRPPGARSKTRYSENVKRSMGWDGKQTELRCVMQKFYEPFNSSLVRCALEAKNSTPSNTTN